MKRPRLLYLAYAFPPSPAIGGVRAWNSAKHLSALGWAVTVVTPAPRLWRRAEEPERTAALLQDAGIGTIATGHDWPMLAAGVRSSDAPAARLVGGACRVVARRLGVDPAAGWAASVARACASAKPGDFDLVLATASPFVSFEAARRLGRRLRCPFVLDYRDPWSGNPHERGGETHEAEASLLRDCAAATVVSPSWAKMISERFSIGNKVTVVSNGFDPAMFDGVQPESFGHFAVVYAGTLYPPKRVLDPVLRAFRAFVEGGGPKDAMFHYYGDYTAPVAEAAARLGVASRVVAHGRVSRSEALRAQKGAGLLVVVSSVEERGTEADAGVMTGKLFDCMALERPALVVAPRGSDLYGAAETSGGMRCFTGSQVTEMAGFIADAAAGRTPPYRDRAAYRWDAIGRRLDGALRWALARGVRAS